MSILTESEIKKELELWNIILHDGQNLVKNPVTLKDQSIDVRLGQFIFVENHITDTEMWIDLVEYERINWKGYKVVPWDFILAHTDEFIWTTAKSDLVSQFFLKSTAGRLWIIHTHSGWGEIGFHNRWAMEFVVAKAIFLKHKQAIWQIIFQRVTWDTVSDDYSKKGHYQTTSDINQLVKSWNKEMIQPWTKELKVITHLS